MSHRRLSVIVTSLLVSFIVFSMILSFVIGGLWFYWSSLQILHFIHGSDEWYAMVYLRPLWNDLFAVLDVLTFCLIIMLTLLAVVVVKVRRLEVEK